MREIMYCRGDYSELRWSYTFIFKPRLLSTICMRALEGFMSILSRVRSVTLLGLYVIGSICNKTIGSVTSQYEANHVGDGRNFSDLCSSSENVVFWSSP